jgi:hypothetical protein
LKFFCLIFNGIYERAFGNLCFSAAQVGQLLSKDGNSFGGIFDFGGYVVKEEK